MAVPQIIQAALALMLLPSSHAILDSPVSSSVTAASRIKISRRQQTGFLVPTSTITSRRHFKSALNTRTYLTPTDETSSSHCYVPPYGMVPRSQSSIVMNMMVNDQGYSDDRFRKKMNSKRTKDPVIQDFGNMRDWQASKTGLGRMGDDKVGDDGVSERFGMMGGPGGPGMGGPGMDIIYEDERDMYNNDDRFDMMEQQQQQQRQGPPPPVFEGDGGNYWVNPSNSMDQFPMQRYGDDARDDRESTMSTRRRGGRRRNNGRDRRDGDDGQFWETRRNEEDNYDDDLFDDFENEDYGNEYGVPPPTRSRSSFRSGAPPPPRPVKSFYDKLFWFGFDPDVTRSTDRTMFGGTRGKFNAIDLLNDREERQRIRGGEGRMTRGGRGGGGRMRGGRGGGSLGSGKGPVIQDFGSVRDWNDRKTGRGRSGGDAVGDDSGRPNYGYDAASYGPPPFPGDMPPPPPPMGMPDYDFNGYNDGEFLMDDGGMDFEERPMRQQQQRRDGGGGGGRRRRRNDRRRNMDSRADDYNRFLGLGPPPPGVDGGDDYIMDNEYNMPRSVSGGSSVRSSSSRRRKGFAYKYNDIDLFDDDGEYIDVEPKYASERDLNMARMPPKQQQQQQRSRRRPSRSWEDRAIEMDRVPPRNAVAWGPNGRIGGGETNPLDRAAMEALGDIKKSKRYLERKEGDVEDAKEEVVSLKADISFCENKLQDTRGGRESSKLEQDLGYLLRDVEDASRNLRLARAERDAASERVSDLEERNWALLSEYEAARSFEEEM